MRTVARVETAGVDRLRIGADGEIARDQVATLVLGTPDGSGDAPASAPTPASAPAPASASASAGRLAEEELAQWIRQADELEARWPGHPMLFLRDESTWTWRPDGSRSRRDRYRIKVVKDSAIAYASFGVSFDPSRERVHLGSIRTVLPDGTVLPLDPAKVKAQDARSSAEHLTNRRELVWRLDGVRSGCFLEHEYEVEEWNPFEPEFLFPSFTFQARAPVALSRLEVRVPKGRPLSRVGRSISLAELGETVRTEGDQDVYTWSLGPVAPYVPEPLMPGAGDVLPGIAVSSLPDWDRFFAWQRASLERNIEPTPEVAERARKVVAGAEGDEAKVAALYRFLQDEIRYVSVKSGIGSGWSGHPASETLANGYGDCVDKSVLFCSMLRTLGIRAQPLILMTNDAHDMETRIPGFDANHCITRVELGERELILDSTTTDYRYPWFRSDDHGQPAADALRGRILTVPVPAPSENRTEREVQLSVSPEGRLSARERWAAVGPSEASQRGFWRKRRREDDEKVFRDYYGSVAPGARVVSFKLGDPEDMATPFGFEAAFEAADYAVAAGDLLIVKLPFFETSFAESALEERRFPIDYRSSRETVIRYRLELPPGTRVRAGPRPVRLETPWAAFALEVEEGAGRWTLVRTHRVLGTAVPAERYPEYRKFLKRIEALGQERLFLEVAP